MKGRRAKKGAVLATAVVFMTIIIALSVLVVVFASSSTKRAVNAAKRANSSIEMNLIADEFVTSVKKEYESYKSGSDKAVIRELPVATIDAHMNEFAQKINENYSCEVSVSASKTYSLKLIETSGEKKTQIMIVSVDVKENEIKEADGVIKIKYTYSVVKWNTTSQTVEEPNVGDVTNEQQVMKLAQKFLQLYISENKDSNTIMFAISRYIQNLSDLDGEKFSDCQYSIVTERNAYGDEICYSVVCEEDGTYDVIFKYNIVLSAEKKEPSFVIYDNKTLKPKYGFVVYGESDIYCVIHPYDDDGNAVGNSGTTVVVTTSATTTTTAIVASEVNQ